MSAAQRRVVLVFCLLLAGVFSWWWYFEPLDSWNKFGAIPGEFIDGGKPVPRPNKPENLLLGIALPLALCGVGFFALFGKSKAKAAE